MKTILKISLIILLIIPSLSINLPVTGKESSTNQMYTSFQYQYNSQNILTNYDIQYSNLNNYSLLYVSFVQNGSIYYNALPSVASNSTNHQLDTSNFYTLSINSTYLNSSTDITASQYYSNQFLSMSIFLIYFTYHNTYYCYIFVYGQTIDVPRIIFTEVGLQYYKSNIIFQYSSTDSFMIVLREAHDFKLVAITPPHYGYGYLTTPPLMYSSTNDIELRDIQFYNNVLYVIADQRTINASFDTYTASVYAISYNVGISYVKYNFSNYISSITFSDNELFAYSQFNNVIYSVDLQNPNQVSQIENSIPDNFTLIRSFSKNSFVLEDFISNLVFGYIPSGGPNVLQYNNTEYLLKNNQVMQIFNSNPQNQGYDLSLIGEYRYYLAGGLYSNGSLNGFGIVLHSINEQPSIFIDSNKTSLSFSSNILSLPGANTDFSYILIALGIVVIIVVFISVLRKRHIANEVNVKKLNTSDYVNNSKAEVFPLKACNVCGTKSHEGDIFCQNCGNRI